MGNSATTIKIGKINLVPEITDHLRSVAIVLTSETKTKILALIAASGKKGVNSGQLIERENIGNLQQSHVSILLREFKSLNLVHCEVVGKNRKYTINAHALSAIQLILQQASVFAPKP